MRTAVEFSGAGGAASTRLIATPPTSLAPKPPGLGFRAMAGWVVAVVLAVGVFPLTVRMFALQVFYIPTPSMQPALVENDRVLVNKLSYRFGDLERRDVVVFDPPREERRGVDHLIKRVVGLPGETVSLREGRVLIDGEPVPETYAVGRTDPIELPQCRADLTRPLTVPEGHVFVLGDNRGVSIDSRCFGPVSADQVVGRAVAVVWPLSNFGGL